MFDVTIVGGGVCGLVIACDLSRRGQRVQLLERGAIGREASWAGAGMLPPGHYASTHSAEAQLRGFAAELWPKWARHLTKESGLDFGYRTNGALRFFNSEQQRDHELAIWHNEGVTADALLSSQIRRIEPALSGDLQFGIHLPEQAQIRNPRYLRALVATCLKYGVDLQVQLGELAWIDPHDPSRGLQSNNHVFESQRYCITAGPWSSPLLIPLGLMCDVAPVRGQIVLLNDTCSTLSKTVEDGFRYLVPRGDGRILVGSTMEHVGFDKRVTADGIASLLQFATHLCPSLNTASIEKQWSGLRPATADQLPLMGVVPDHEHVFVATGHLRGGLQNSPATAHLMSQLLRDEKPDINLTPYSPVRFTNTVSYDSLGERLVP